MGQLSSFLPPMTVPVSSSFSTASNLDFNLDEFPPPRPSTATVRGVPSVRKPKLPSRTSSSCSDRVPALRMPSPPSPKSPGLPSSPRSPRSPRILETGVRRFASPRSRSGLRGALAGLFTREPEPELDIPIQDRPPVNSSTHVDVRLNAWPPLHVEKRPGAHSGSCRCTNPKRRRQKHLCIVLLMIVLLYLLANTILLNVRVLSPRSSLNSPSNRQYGASNDTYTLSAAQELCLTQFTVNAPANASLYPCSTCLGFLQDIPASFSFSTTDGAQTLSNSLQFCGLQALLGASGATAQNALVNGGWAQDVNFCTWTGVQCDGEGKVESLETVFPAVPSVIPSGIGALTALQTLQITGGGDLPAGSIPDSLANLTALTTLHLESTTLSALPSTLFSKGALGALTTLTLVKNTGFGGSLPDVSGLALQSFIVSEQQLSTPLTSLLNSTTLQNSLTTLSLTSANLTGSFPSSASFSSLQTLSLANNSALSGAVPNALCDSSVLASCDLSGTGLTGTDGSCGVCTF